MRFLCLHGMGTNSAILEAQIEQVRDQLGPTFEFIFLDGQINCEPAPGISNIYPGPYLCYHPYPPSALDIAEAQELVISMIEDEGPFDGLLGFSQGAALAASVIIQQSTIGKQLVDCAVFICACFPWLIDSPCFVESDQPGRNTQKSLAQLGLEGFMPEELSAKLLHPQKLLNSPIGISIPTVHILGGQTDKYIAQSRALVILCEKNRRDVKAIDHEGGHIVPRGQRIAGRITKIITWAAERTKY